MALSNESERRPEPSERRSRAARSLDVTAALAGERLLITGATGFLGKVLVEKILWSVPEIGGLVLLIRAGDEREAGERLRREVLGSPIMARLRALHGEDWKRWAASRVEAIAGDLGRDRLGLSEAAYSALCRRVDRVVGAAATVRFDERLDRALEVNTRGALETLELARDAGEAPLVHVSTCFVSGRRLGPVWEEVDGAGPDGDLDSESLLAHLEEAAWLIRSQSAGGPDPDAPWIAAGREQAERCGFHDVYTLTKALAERLLARRRGGVPLAVVRPAIVESARAEPIPGWIDSVRVTDPLLVAYGRGLTREIPGAADARLDLVPVDAVVNALIAVLADLGPERDGPRVYQITSGRNPLTLGELVRAAREGFGRAPLRDEHGRPIVPARPRFVEPQRFRRGLLARRAKERTRAGRRRLDHLLRLIDVYRPYLDHGASYQDPETMRLWERLSPAEREIFPFDLADLDWRGYLSEVHVPGLVRFALRAETGAPAPASAAPVRRRALASAQRRAVAAASVFELFCATAEAAPETPAFQTYRAGRWLRYTYGEALAASANIAWRLAERHGVGHGDRVALWGSGGPEWVLTLLALHRLGAVAVPLDPQWPAAEVEEAMRFVGAKLACVAPALAGTLGPSAPPAVELAPPLVPEPDVGLLPGAGGHDSAVAEDDLALVVFTSGTTVAPRAVPLTHGNLLANVRDLVPLMELSRERLVSVLPIHHVFELMVGLLVPIAGASTLSYVAEVKPAEIGWMMATTRPTVLVAVPRLLELLHGGIFRSVAEGGPWLGRLFRVLFALSRLTGGRLGHLLFSKVHRRFGGSLRRIATGGSALEPALGRSFRLMGFRVAEGYGMTETSPVLTVNPWRALRFGSVGRPLRGVEVEIRPRPAAAPATSSGDDGAGEIWVRGANVMRGYWADPEATAAAMDDGWLATGDLGFLDADGYLHVSGRAKDVIVTAAGKNVYPEEVEARYKDLPGVEELVVVGLPVNGPGAGERVIAVVVPAAGAAAGAEEAALERIRAAIAERSAAVPSYQRVAGVELWHGELPKTTTLKVKRQKLRERILEGRRGEAVAPSASPTRRPAAEPETAPSREQAWIVATLARLTHTRPEHLGVADRLAELGIDSLTRVELLAAMEERFGLRLDDEAAAALERVGDLVALAPAGAGAGAPAGR